MLFTFVLCFVKFKIMIKTKEEYDKKLKRLGEVFNARAGTPENDEAEKLCKEVSDYEDEHYPIPDCEDSEMVKFLKDQNGE